MKTKTITETKKEIVNVMNAKKISGKLNRKDVMIIFPKTKEAKYHLMKRLIHKSKLMTNVKVKIIIQRNQLIKTNQQIKIRRKVAPETLAKLKSLQIILKI